MSFLAKRYVTFCGAFPNVKDMPTSTQFISPDRPHFISHVLEHRECDVYIKISFSLTDHNIMSFQNN